MYIFISCLASVDCGLPKVHLFCPCREASCQTLNNQFHSGREDCGTTTCRGVHRVQKCIYELAPAATRICARVPTRVCVCGTNVTSKKIATFFFFFSAKERAKKSQKIDFFPFSVFSEFLQFSLISKRRKISCLMPRV